MERQNIEATAAATTAPAAARGKEQEPGQERPWSAPEEQTWPVCSVSTFRQAGCQVWKEQEEQDTEEQK
ncbi:hypothetical protein PGIGA_G00144030 [Pangasianodon gigas]|uniref:Uncharacterized protein n=1 Tax=Pangasianodon gigas TaxID=30993 RepID=A0ACC5XMF2_PANGG|nr:hypothetical protein [Pangasianodon gigas]